MLGANTILSRLGWPVTVESGGQSYPVQAIVQPIHDRNKLYLEADFSSLGQLEKGHAIYYGPPLAYPVEGDFIRFGEEFYFVRRAEFFYCQGKPFYRWAVVQRATEEGSHV